jgi:hypothetical protein
MGFETTIPASERPQTQALDRVATGIGQFLYIQSIFSFQVFPQNKTYPFFTFPSSATCPTFPVLPAWDTKTIGEKSLKEFALFGCYEALATTINFEIVNVP